MLVYLQINLVIFALACAALFVLRSAPARIRFSIVIVALLSWAVPWNLVAGLVDSDHARLTYTVTVADVETLKDTLDEEVLVSNARKIAPQGPSISLEAFKNSEFVEAVKAADLDRMADEFKPFQFYSTVLLFIVLAAVAVYLFCKDLVLYRRSIAHWFAVSQPGNHLAKECNLEIGAINIRIVPDTGPGMSTGVRRPTIWISSRIERRSDIKAVLLHELTHIKHHDVYWAWALTFLGRVFWWNPLVYFLCHKARELIEFSCDEACNRQLENGRYAASLTHMILNSNQHDGGDAVLGMQKSKNLNVRRVRALSSLREVRTSHILAVAILLTVASSACLAIVGRQAPVDSKLEFRSVSNLDRARSVGEGGLAVVAPDEVPFVEFTEMLIREEHESAELLMQQIVADLVARDEFKPGSKKRELVFRALASMHADRGDYHRVLEDAKALLQPEVHWRERQIARIIAVAHIRLKNYQAAVELLHKSESLGYRGDPSRAVLAQAYHLIGEYKKSNDVIIETLPIFDHASFYTSKITMLRLMGKNSTILGDLATAERIRQKLGALAPADFMDIKANQQTIPYVYFASKVVDGVDIDGFDTKRFPMPTLVPQATHAEISALLESVNAASNAGNFKKAIVALESGLMDFKDVMTEKEKIRMLEYLFMMHLSRGDGEGVKSIAMQLADLKGVLPGIKARAYYILSTGPRKYVPENLGYYLRYYNMFDTPSLSADHEIVERFFLQQDVSPAVEALERVVAFYDERGIVPDIKMVNRFLGLYTRLGNEEQVQRYRAVMAMHYPRATDFMFE